MHRYINTWVMLLGINIGLSYAEKRSFFKPKTWFAKQDKKEEVKEKKAQQYTQELKDWFVQFDEEVLLDMLERFEHFERLYQEKSQQVSFDPEKFTPGGQTAINDTLKNRLPLLRKEIARRDTININAAQTRRYKRKLVNAGFSEQEAQRAVPDLKQLVEDAHLDIEKAIEQLKYKQKTIVELKERQKGFRSCPQDSDDNS